MNTRSLPRSPLARSVAAWWPWIRRALVGGFLLLVAFLLVRYARTVDWHDVLASIRSLPASVIALAAAFAAASFLLYTCFDLMGRRYTGHALGTGQVMQIAFTSYAFNLNMGSAVGGVGFRLRLYSRLGLAYADIARILTLSMVSNWLGHLLLAGCLFTFAPLEMPPGWKLDSHGLQLLGIGLLAIVATYLVLCAVSKKRSWTVRGHTIELPPARMALLQVGVSALNWMAIAAVIHTLLQGRAEYFPVLSVLLIAAMAGLIVRVPAGLGVLETVFIALLSHQVPQGQLLGALLAYRAIYYIVPLAFAAVLYLRMELDARRQRAP
ncbi:lysylphosphatidylglycerol synthase domain-containing protein [Ramlibacter sp.]|uniref:lysylphosphatidylglycerol synthase domain-containing protein n=1 Tax=Ramlibacter sp. TaxID=1917967 RepID=UPI003D0D5699